MKNKKDLAWKKNRERVSIAILTHNGWEKGVLQICLQSLIKQDYPNAEIIVVDNCSTDGSAEKIKDWYMHHRSKFSLRVIKNTKNSVASAINIVIKKSKAKYIAVFGDDTQAMPDALKGIIEAMESDIRIGVAMFRSMNYFERDKIDSVGDSFDFYGNAEVGKYGEIYRGQYTGIREIPLAGVAYVFRRNIVSDIGLFDEMFHTGYEDADFCIRARLYGYRIVSVSDAVIFHRRGASYNSATKDSKRILESMKFNFYKDQFMILIKNYELKNLMIALPIAVFMYLPMGLYQAFFQKKPKDLWLRIKSILWVIYHSGYILKQRQFVQKIRKFPDTEIMRYMSKNLYVKYLGLSKR